MAILKRGKKRDFFKKIRETLWPSQGWSRTFHYYRHRIFRTGDSTYKITAGLASGAAVSWSPFLGTHFAQAILLAWLVRANPLAGFVGTVIGNPWTFPAMFWTSYKLGMIICGPFGLSEFVALPADMDFASIAAEPWIFLQYIFSHPLKLLLPLTIGGYLCALLFWPVAYGILYYPVRVARKAYRVQRVRFRKMKQEKRR